MKGGNGVRFSERNYAFAGTANKTFDPRTHIDEPARGSPLPHCWYEEQPLSQNNPSDPLDRGCFSRRKNSRGAAEMRRKYAKNVKNERLLASRGA